MTANGKPTGAYRPPGARGTPQSDASKRGDDSGPSSGTSTPTPMFKGGKPSQRYVPGSVPGAAAPSPAEDKKKRARNKPPLVSPEPAIAAPVAEMSVLEVDEAKDKRIRNLGKKVSVVG